MVTMAMDYLSADRHHSRKLWHCTKIHALDENSIAVIHESLTKVHTVLVIMLLEGDTILITTNHVHTILYSVVISHLK